MTIQTVTDAIRYVGVDDNTLALFENQYPVQPMGVSYNSYVILDEKIAVMDSVDARAAEEWLSNVARVLEGRSPDYLVVTHMEPDHSGSLMRLAQKYPEMKIVGNAKTFTMIKQFFGTGALSEDRIKDLPINKPILIQNISLPGKCIQHFGCPLTELRGTGGIGAVANSNNGGQGVEFVVIGLAIICNLCKFCTSCTFG